MRVERGVGEDASDGRGFRMALEGQPGCTKPLPAVTDCYVVDRGTRHAPNPLIRIFLIRYIILTKLKKSGKKNGK